MDAELVDDLGTRTDVRPSTTERFSVGTCVGDVSSEIEEDCDFEDGPRSSRDVGARLAHRPPAQTRPLADSDDGVAPKGPRMPDPTSPTVSYDSDMTGDGMLAHAHTIQVCSY